MSIPPLSRGDSIPEGLPSAHRWSALVTHFCGTGLIARFATEKMPDQAGRTNYDIVKNKKLPWMVAAHIGYEASAATKEFSAHSPFISFSSEPDCAFRFMTRERPLLLENCEFHNARFFTWALRFDATDLTLSPWGKGCYQFVYQSDPANCTIAIASEYSEGLRRYQRTGEVEMRAGALGRAIAAGHAAKNTKEHCALIIDAVTYLTDQGSRVGDDKLLNLALTCASDDREWLVYPCDPMDKWVASTFHMNRHLSIGSCLRERSG